MNANMTTSTRREDRTQYKPLKAVGMANESIIEPSTDADCAARPSSCIESSKGCLYILYALKSMASALSVFMRLFSSNAVSINDSNTVIINGKTRNGGKE